MRKIGLDARLTRQMSVGMKAYAVELAARLPRVAPDLCFENFAQGANFSWDEQVRLPAAMRRARVDLAHFLSLYTPVFAPRPYIVTIHDLIHLRFPQYFKSKVTPYYQTVVRFACARAARIVTDDERTVADLERFLGVRPERVRVIPLGVDDRYLRPVEPFRAQRPYVLYAGNHRPHKDLATLVAAWQTVARSRPLDLYVTGPADVPHDAVANGELVALGDVDADRLAGLYAGAAALVHPALCEGFGLPMLEAMACGAPVVACADALPGVLRGAALTFPARDARAAAAAIDAVLSDEQLRIRLTEEGRARARGLTWDRCAAQTAAIYREVLQER